MDRARSWLDEFYHGFQSASFQVPWNRGAGCCDWHGAAVWCSRFESCVVLTSCRYSAHPKGDPPMTTVIPSVVIEGSPFGGAESPMIFRASLAAINPTAGIFKALFTIPNHPKASRTLANWIELAYQSHTALHCVVALVNPCKSSCCLKIGYHRQAMTKPYLSFFYPVPSIPRTRIIAADLEGTIWVFSMRDKRDCKAARFVERVQFESRKRTNLDHTWSFRAFWGIWV